MKYFTDINLSIRWKLFGAFLIAVFTPLLLIFLKVPWAITLIVATLLCLGLGWYSVWRILLTLSTLRYLTRLYGGTLNQRSKKKYFKDELNHFLYSFEHFVQSLASTKKLESLKPSKEKEPNLQKGRQVFKAGMATGDPVAGIAALLPQKLAEELLLAERLSGEEGLKLFFECLKSVTSQLTALIEINPTDDEKKGIIEFQLLLLDDESFLAGMKQYINQGLSLPESINTVFSVFISNLEKSPHVYIRAKVTDCLDLKQRLLETLARDTSPRYSQLYAELKDKIVLSDQIFPTEIISLQKVGVKGIVTATGTATSHSAILLESYHLPSLTNTEGVPIHLLHGKHILLDTHKKQLIIEPSEDDLKSMTASTEALEKSIIQQQINLASSEAIHVEATINNVYSEALKAHRFGADGVGLFRSEISFIGKSELPTEEELYEEYKFLIDTFAGKPVVLRMLDLGSDKLAAFQNDIREENPCMGNRSTRLLIRRPDIFQTQIRAMLRAGNDQTTIIFPLISSWSELERIDQMKQTIIGDLLAQGFSHVRQINYGIMVEVPSIVERFEDYVQAFDVFNIGSNDLTQYTLAADRNNREVAQYYNYYHPAILSMIKKVCDLADKYQKKVILCGEMASHITPLKLLTGLGIRNWSVPYRAIPKIKSHLKSLHLMDCQKLANQALSCKSAQEVENLKLNHASGIYDI